MKTIPHVGKLLFLLAFTLISFSCSNDDGGGPGADDDVSMEDPSADDDVDTEDPASDAPTLNLVELVSETEELSLLEEALIQANLTNDLTGEGPFTVFAPTNGAIEELFDTLGDDFNSFDDFDDVLEILLLQTILRYHVVPGNLTSSDLQVGTLATLLEDETLEVIASGDTFVIGDASDIDAHITGADNLATNGVAHIIDKILIPQEILDLIGDIDTGSKTISELVMETEGLSFLEEALELTGLLETLDTEGPFTVFAPSDDSLNELLAFLGVAFNGIEDFDTEFEINLLRDILLYHVVPGEVRSTDLNAGNLNPLLEGSSLEVVADGNGFALRDVTTLTASFVLTDISAENGVIHTIDRILLPQSVLDDLAMETEALILEFLASQDNLDEIRNTFILVRDNVGQILDGRPFTFFFPNDAAFIELFNAVDGVDSISDFNTPDGRLALARILGYHCIPATFTSSDFSDGQSLTTFQGENVTVTVNGDHINIIDATGIPSKVVNADNHIINGVIHVVDKVLIPQEVLNLL
ncbi:MAG: fasciclin domain-containing protein [Bacteroidota bacterium]